MASSYPGALDTFDSPGSTLAGPPTHSSLHTALNDAVAAIQATLGINPGKRQSFTPTLTASTTNPTLGTGSVAMGAYSRVGDRVEGEGVIVFGTSPSAGSGNYRLSLPTAQVGTTPPYRYSGTPANATVIGSFQMWDGASSTQQGQLQLAGSGASTVMLQYGTNQVTNAAPFVPVAGTVITYLFAYFAA